MEKVKTRQTFETIVRQKIDPGIIHKIKGNFFKRKIYPVPVLGHKRVEFTLTETLVSDDQYVYYTLPVSKQLVTGEFFLDAKLIKSQAHTSLIRSEFENLEFDHRDDARILHF